MIEYYTSTLNPDCFFVALDGVMVGQYCELAGHPPFWMDRSIYRPVRSHYIKVDWHGVPYDPATLVEPEQWEIVKRTGREAPLDEIIAEVARLKAKAK